ncbi:MAG: hypothetical protein JXA46_10870 [Dehalococcoidales bacterium]|nr:hypothetical protein [Dehalococcoidales bacterium]
MENTRYGKYIISNLKTPSRFTPEFNEAYAKWAKRVLWIDKDVVDGAFQMNCSWYLRPPDVKTAEATAHTHDADEIIGFFGNNWEDPYNLGAEIEFWLEDEMHIITGSSLIFVPRGMKHCPLILRRVDRPIFHFSTVTSGTYNYLTDKK